MTSETSNTAELMQKLQYYEAIFSTDALHVDIRQKLKTTPQLAAVVKLLLLADSELITNSSIVMVAEPYGRKADHQDKYAKVIAWRIRKLLGGHSITMSNQYGDGYLFKTEDKEKLKEVLK
jgi:hypothetical protein